MLKEKATEYSVIVIKPAGHLGIVCDTESLAQVRCITYISISKWFS